MKPIKKAVEVLKQYSNQQLVVAYNDLKEWRDSDRINDESILFEMASQIQKELEWEEINILNLHVFIMTAISERFANEWNQKGE